MAIVSCPACDKKLKVADTSVGKKVKCSCGNIFIAAAEASAPVAAAVPDKVMVGCTECGAKLKVANSSLGKKMKCPKCSSVFVAALDEEPPLAAPIKKPAPPVADEIEEIPPAKPAKKGPVSPFEDEEEEAPKPAKKKDDDEPFTFQDEEEAPRAKGKRKTDDDEEEKPKAKPKTKPPAQKSAPDKPVYPSRILANLFVTLLLLGYAVIFVLVFVFELPTYMPPSKILGQTGKPKVIKTDPDAENKKELAKFDGTWVVESAETDDKPIPQMKGKKFTFADGKATTPGDEGPFTVDVSQDPKWIDMPGPEKMPVPGIYKFEDDATLHLCSAIPEMDMVGGKEIVKPMLRPKKFESEKAKLFKLKRQEKKEDSKEVDNKKEAAKLHGTWIVQSVEMQGKVDKAYEGAEFVFADGTVTFPGGKPGPFSVDAGKDPKTIDMTMSPKVTFHGIYQLEGDKLTICHNEFKPEPSPRPTKFDSNQGPLYVFTRKKDEVKKPEPEKKKDATKLDGAWVVESAMAAGKPIPQLKGNRFVFADQKVTMPGEPAPTPYKADFTKDPHWLDITSPDAKMTVPTIFKFEGENLRWALPAEKDAKDRPKGFDSPEVLVVVLRRAGKDDSAYDARLSVRNLKFIGIGLHSYHDANKHLPAAGISGGKNGKPLLSWRVAILPYLDQIELYKEFDLDLPWDHPHNMKLIAKMPKEFMVPGVEAKEGMTHYRALVGPGTPLEPLKGPKDKLIARTLLQITDGTSYTIMVVEAAEPTIWTKPDDLAYDPKGPLPKFGVVPAGFNALFVDGTVHFIPANVREGTLRPYLTATNGEAREPLDPKFKGKDDFKDFKDKDFKDKDFKKDGFKDKDFDFKDKDFKDKDFKDKDFKKDGFKDKDIDFKDKEFKKDKDGKSGARAPVEGVVRLDGKPLPDGEVWFVPPRGAAVKLKINPDGSFSGLVNVGFNKVEIHRLAAANVDPKAPRLELIPPQYNAKTTLIADVADRVNDFSFELKSK